MTRKNKKIANDATHDDGVDETGKLDALVDNDDSDETDDITEPGDCIGNYLEGDMSCGLCEIADACRALTNEGE